MYLNSDQGVFISFEGVEGSGKSTLAAHVHEQLQSAGFDCLLLREPGATALGEQLRTLILARGELEIGCKTELLLFLAARAQNIEENILPALKRRQIVLCDRYTDSTIAYQAAGRGLDLAMVKRMCEWASGGLEPHVTLYLDVDPAIGCQRARQSKQGGDRLDQESLEFHQRVHGAYQALVLDNPQRMVCLDAGRPLEQLLQEGWGLVQTALDRHTYFQTKLAPGH